MYRSVELEVSARVAYQRICRIDEYHLYRAGVREVTALSDTAHRWRLDGASLTTRVAEQRPDRLLRWLSIEGPTCGETVTVEPLSPHRSRLSIEASGPPALLEHLVADLTEFKRRVERDHHAVPTGHFVNERPVVAGSHHSNWRDDLLR
jgi:hypothetical protein